MEALYIQSWEQDGVMIREDEEQNSGDQEEGGMEASIPMASITEEETDEDKPELPSVIRRKVSFADAFGLNLVSVKEFDNAVTEADVSLPPERAATRCSEEFFMSCLFTVPSSPEELDQRLQAQMVELESIELLPGTTTIRGIIRVVNLCYSKSVYVRMSLDRWTSYFDLLAEYVPGSSDRKTDRFTFKYNLLPPFESEGTRVEICLRYDTPLGTFWANNNEINYVLFCHKKGHANEHGPQVQEENASYKSKRSCLRTSRRASVEEKTSNTSPVCAETGAAIKAEEMIQSLLYQKEHKPLVDSIKSRRRETHMAHVKEYLSQRRQHLPKAYSHDSAHSQDVAWPSPTLRGNPAHFLNKRQRKQSKESPQVLTYHEIPLLTLDWNNDESHQLGTTHMDNLQPGGTKVALTKASVDNKCNTHFVSDKWETFLESTDEETSVCDVWQAFVDGSSSLGHSAVPESEWLQTATSVSPSNDEEPKTQYAAGILHEFQIGKDTPSTSHARTVASCQLQSNTRKALLASVALNTADQQPAEECVSSPRDDNTATQDPSQRSETNSPADTLPDSSLKGGTLVSEDSVCGSAECHKHAMWERRREGIIEGTEEIGGDEPFTPPTADLVTSSGESETTDMIVMPESQNASVADRILQGARLDEGLSSSREGQVTGSRHNAMDDVLAFSGTIKWGTKDVGRFVFSTSRQEVGEGIVNIGTENKVSTGEEIFRPQKTEECEISQRYADEKQCREFRLNRNSRNPLQENESNKNEIRPVQSQDDGFNPDQTCHDNFKQSQMLASISKSEESEYENLASNNEDLELFKKTEEKLSLSRTSGQTKTLIGAEMEIIPVLNKEERQHNEKALQLNSSWQRGNASIISGVHNKPSKPIQAGEVVQTQKEEKEEDTMLTQIQEDIGLKAEGCKHELVLNHTEEGQRLICDGITEEQQEVNLTTQTWHRGESRGMQKVFRGDHDTFRLSAKDTCNPAPVDVGELRWAHSHNGAKGQKEDIGLKNSPKEVIKAIDSSGDIQHQPEALGRIKEDMSQRGNDERVSLGKQKMEALWGLTGNSGIPEGERKNAKAQLKEQELSEDKSSPHVEYEKLLEGTKEPITTENTVALEEIESGLEKMFIERFVEDLVRATWEEVFNLKAQASNRDLNIADGMVGKMVDTSEVKQDCHLLFEKDVNDTFDSGVFSLTELPSDLSLCQNLERTLVAKSNDYFPQENSEALITTEQTFFLQETQPDSNSRAHLGQDLVPISAAQSKRPLTESAQSFASDHENSTQIKERSVTRHETGRQMEECGVAHRETLNRSDHKHLSTSSEKLKEFDSLVWWSVLYILSHITRFLICTLFVVGFFFIVFLCDFPAFFALYVFSLCWWFYKWKGHQVTTTKRMIG